MLILPKSHLVSKISIYFLSKLLKIKVQQNFAFVKRSRMKENIKMIAFNVRLNDALAIAKPDNTEGANLWAR
jgi:uncharacterized membrane protein